MVPVATCYEPTFSPNGTLWNVDPTTNEPQSALMLSAWITLPHFSVSSAINLPNAADVIDIGSTAPKKNEATQVRNRPEGGRKFKPMVPVATCYEPTFSPNGTLWNVGRGSLRLDIGRADHIAPPLGFVGDKLAKIGRRTRKQRAA